MAQISSCQTPILPLSTYENIPNGAYLKDINNVLTPYIGTWEGILNNKKYTFVFTKFAQRYNSFSSYYQDELMGNFKVTDLSTGTVLYDNTAATNYDDFRIYGTHPNVARGMCSFYFTDTVANCENNLKFILRNINGQPNKLTYCYFEYDGWLKESDCHNYPNRAAIPVFLPTQELILTKL